MAIFKCKSVKNKIQNTAGETLMETVISIAIFLIAMAAITGLVKTATNLNVEARELSQKIEQAGEQVEADSGDEKGAGTMNFDFDGTTFSQVIMVKSADPFIYFQAKEQVNP